ncbi:hypothetical protein [Plantibacter sp. 2H11-2]|uniref:hypothetical protein n=1 Tax=Plantibacter sp. 2H11-2 TaxID=3414431 RepID=UPI003CEED9F7
MTEEQTVPSSDLSQDQQGWVETYQRGQQFRDPEPDDEKLFDDSEDVHGDDPRPEADVQRRIAEAQMDLLLRFTGASDYAGGNDPDSWLDTFYALAGKWHGQHAAIDEQLESIDQVLSQTGGPLWRPDSYLPLDKVHQASVDAVPASPETAPSTSASSWREPPRLIDWTPDEDPAAGYLRDLHASRQEARESGLFEHSVDAPDVASSSRFAELARKLSKRVHRPHPHAASNDAHPPHQSVSGRGLEL